ASTPTPNASALPESSEKTAPEVTTETKSTTPVKPPVEVKPEVNSVDEATNTVDEQKPGVVKGEAAIQTDDEGKDEKSDGVSSDTEVVKTDERPSDLDGKKCSEWTPQDVEKYFNDKGLPEAGALFREQVFI
ncbi:unnamed protein product, partial [Allacma fusca]